MVAERALGYPRLPKVACRPLTPTSTTRAILSRSRTLGSLKDPEGRLPNVRGHRTELRRLHFLRMKEKSWLRFKLTGLAAPKLASENSISPLNTHILFYALPTGIDVISYGQARCLSSNFCLLPDKPQFVFFQIKRTF